MYQTSRLPRQFTNSPFLLRFIRVQRTVMFRYHGVDPDNRTESKRVSHVFMLSRAHSGWMRHDEDLGGEPIGGFDGGGIIVFEEDHSFTDVGPEEFMPFVDGFDDERSGLSSEESCGG